MEQGLFAGLRNDFFTARYVAAFLLIASPGLGSQCELDDTDPMDPEAEIATIEVSPSSVTLSALDETVTLTAVGRDTEGNTMSGLEPIWNSSRPAVATVSESGVVRAVGMGSSEVTAEADGVVSEAVEITVNGADDPGDPPPPPPPPSGPCDVTHDASQGAPNDAVNSAASGSVVCLTGAYDLSHSFTTGNARDGVDNLLLDVTQSGITIDMSGATVKGDFDTAENLAILLSGQNLTLLDPDIEVGFILIGEGNDNCTVTIERPHIRRAVAPDGNFGLIRAMGGGAGGIRPTCDVIVIDPVLTDVYGCNSGPTGNCAGQTPQPWDALGDVEHLAAFTVQGDSRVELYNATLRRAPAGFYFKQFERERHILVQNGSLAEAQRVGQCRGGNMDFVDFDYGGVQQSQSSDRQCVTKP